MVKTKTITSTEEELNKEKGSLFFERKLENATAGLSRGYFNLLKNKISKEDALTVRDYITSLKTEINPSDNYRRSVIRILTDLCRVSPGLRQLGRKDVLAFLDSIRKPEAIDPLHQWIGTYNLYRVHLIRFFKWLYSPDVEPDKRPKPSAVENIPQLKRKEKSIYKPTDLWTSEDDLLFEILSFKANEMFSYYGQRYQLPTTRTS